MIVLNYSLTKKDHYYYNYYVLWSSPASKIKRRNYYLKQLIYFPIGYLISMLIINRPFDLLSLGLYSIFFIATLMLIPDIMKRRVRQQVERLLKDPKNEQYLAHTQLVISEQGISTKNQFSKSDYSWSAFVKKEETKEYYYLFINGMMAITIPKRILKKEEIDQLDLYLSKYISLSAEFNAMYESKKAN